MLKAVFLFVLFVSTTTLAQSFPRSQGPSDLEIQKMAEHNAQVALEEKRSGVLRNRESLNVLPFAEYQTTGFVVFSDDDFYGVAEEMKNLIAQNLPSQTTLLVYTDSSSKQYQQQLFNKYAQYLPADRLKILQVPASGSNHFWSRDNLPLPVWKDGQFSLVDARYYYNFEPDSFFKNLFNVSMSSHKYFFEGGNFMANSKGDCIVVNRRRSYPGGVSDTAAIPDDVFKSLYGCKTLTRFKHLKGIGHADEVVKFMSDSVIYTDTAEYIPILEKAGFQVVLLPEGPLNYETYINSLQVNDTIFVPVFGEAEDKVALDAYKKLGLKVVPVPTRELATQGQGGIHCITMNYPSSSLPALLRMMNAKVVK